MSRPRLTPRPPTPVSIIIGTGEATDPFGRGNWSWLLAASSEPRHQVMRHWAPHVAAKEAPPNDRCKQMLALHCKQSFPVIPRAA